MIKHDGTTHGPRDMGPRIKTTMDMTDGELAVFDRGSGLAAERHVADLDAASISRRAKYLEDSSVFEAQLDATLTGGEADDDLDRVDYFGDHGRHADSE